MGFRFDSIGFWVSVSGSNKQSRLINAWFP